MPDMPIPLLEAKLRLPRPDPAADPHRVERLNTALDRRLTVVCAPASSGKTALLATWAVHCGAGLAWLSMDEGDNDPLRFLAHLFAGFERIDGWLGADALAALQSSISWPPEELLRGLVTQIAAFPAPCVLVLDDYDRVDSGAIHGLLTFLLEYQPPPLHIVLACRTEPPLPLDGLRAAGQLLELRAEDLR